MPLFKVNVKMTVTTTYDDIEIDAADADEAKQLGEELVKDGDVNPDGFDETLSSEVTEVA